MDKKELLGKYSRVSTDKSQLQQFAKDVIQGKIGGDNDTLPTPVIPNNIGNTLEVNENGEYVLTDNKLYYYSGFFAVECDDQEKYTIYFDVISWIAIPKIISQTDLIETLLVMLENKTFLVKDGRNNYYIMGLLIDENDNHRLINSNENLEFTYPADDLGILMKDFYTGETLFNFEI